MTELDQVWSEMLGDAYKNAAASGRNSVADYLRLKATNDSIRAVGVKWLFDTFVELAGHAVRQNAALAIERQEPHSFKHGNSNMVGSLLSISHGVRCLTVEAGWTRTPGDGVMRGGALAFARVLHFGMPRSGEELRFVHAEVFPRWVAETGESITGTALRRHLDLLLSA
jgi:hypothetical protein